MANDMAGCGEEEKLTCMAVLQPASESSICSNGANKEVPT